EYIRRVQAFNTDIPKEVLGLERLGMLKFYNKQANIIGIKLLPGHEGYKALVDPGKRQAISLLQMLKYGKNMLEAIVKLHHDNEYIKGTHEERIALFHRDIKPSNFIIDFATDSVTLCDLGLSRQIENKEPTEIDQFILDKPENDAL